MPTFKATAGVGLHGMRGTSARAAGALAWAMIQFVDPVAELAYECMAGATYVKVVSCMRLK
jgi:hypothetical protein